MNNRLCFIFFPQTGEEMGTVIAKQGKTRIYCFPSKQRRNYSLVSSWRRKMHCYRLPAVWPVHGQLPHNSHWLGFFPWNASHLSISLKKKLNAANTSFLTPGILIQINNNTPFLKLWGGWEGRCDELRWIYERSCVQGKQNQTKAKKTPNTTTTHKKKW